VTSLARRLATSYSRGVTEPAYEVSIQELTDSPHLLDKALRSVARGRTVRLVTGAQEPVADIIPDSLLQELEETIEVLADSEAVLALVEAREAAARGDVVRGIDAVRALLDGRQ
jgi:PHD/YefM family antitoxin component YafN of YafNO toxin-antitoxin module